MHDVANCREPECFGCKAASIQFNPFATPSRLHPEHAPRREPDSFARGVHRYTDGTPIHRSDGSVIGLREPVTAVKRELRDRAERNAAGVLSTQER